MRLIHLSSFHSLLVERHSLVQGDKVFRARPLRLCTSGLGLHAGVGCNEVDATSLVQLRMAHVWVRCSRIGLSLLLRTVWLEATGSDRRATISPLAVRPLLAIVVVVLHLCKNFSLLCAIY